jgi:Skp family chaperone for outer membrane proteins
MTQESKQSGINPGVMTAAVVGIVVVVLALGLFFGGAFDGGTEGQTANSGQEGRIVELEASVDYLAGIVASLEGGSSGEGGSARIAYVDMFKILTALYSADDEEVRAALNEYQVEEDKIRDEIALVQKQFADSDISLNERDVRMQELQFTLEQKNLQLSAPIQQRILEEVNKIGEERRYSAIFDNPASKLGPIILFSVPGQADDITDEIIRRLGITAAE